MRTINSEDYHDYFIKNGEFIGEFEQMYQNIEDPHHCVALAERLDNDLLLTLAAHVRPDISRALDIGCGLGKLTHRLATTLPGVEIHACDISPTAIARAQASYPSCHFFTFALGEEPLPFDADSVDLVQMAQVIWCILPELGEVLGDIRRILKPGRHLMIQNGFYASADQKYGADILGTTGDLVRLLQQAGFDIRSEIHISPRAEAGRPQNSLIWATKA